MNTKSPPTLLVLLGLLFEIAAIGFVGFIFYYTIRYRSGLNEPDKLHRIWAHASEIRYQPVKHPLIFAATVGYGAQSVLGSLILGGLSLLGFRAIHPGLVILIACFLITGASAAIGVLVYRVSGGTRWKDCFAATYALGIGMYLLSVWSQGFYGEALDSLDNPGKTKTILWVLLFVLAPIVILFIQIPFGIYAGYRNMPPTARLIYNSTIVPDWVRLNRAIIITAVPLAIVYVVAQCLTFFGSDTYLTGLTTVFANYMVLLTASLSAIISVNRAFLANEFQWQWRAYLTPAVPLFMLDAIYMFLKLLRGNTNLLAAIVHLAHQIMAYGSCGAMGAYVYQIFAAKYAKSHMNEDDLASSDVFDGFDDDEDHAELEV